MCIRDRPNAWVRSVAKDLTDGWRVCKLQGQKMMIQVVDWPVGSTVELPSLPPGKVCRTAWSVSSDGGVFHLAGPSEPAMTPDKLTVWAKPPSHLPELFADPNWQWLCTKIWKRHLKGQQLPVEDYQATKTLLAPYGRLTELSLIHI